MNNLQEVLRAARKRQGISQNEVADGIGMSRSTYAVKEKTGSFNERELESIKKIVRIDATLPSPNGDDYKDKYISILESNNVDLRDGITSTKKELQQVNSNLVQLKTDLTLLYAQVHVMLEEMVKGQTKTEKDRTQHYQEVRKRIGELLKKGLDTNRSEQTDN